MIWTVVRDSSDTICIVAIVAGERITDIAILPLSYLATAEAICTAHNRDLQYLNPELPS